eukprot:GGOE01002072.1.p1 GENE.GGOE01002072.1~~GGOE01002072.1.p1  ORF type:complete len:274 (+),score=51.80 GGOE01002072.1:73-822(+)
MSPQSPTTLRILCLHGYLQSADKFRGKSYGLMKGLKKQAEFDFIDAPHLIEPIDVAEGAAPRYTWWRSVDVPTGKRYDGFWESVQRIVEVLKLKGPYDGILGFSQGAMMAALMLAVVMGDSEVDAVDLPRPTRHALKAHLRFGILAGGFKPRDIRLHRLFAEPVRGVQTLHIIGESDALVPPERSHELADLFADAEVMTHAGGHYIPASAEHRTVYRDFLQRVHNGKAPLTSGQQIEARAVPCSPSLSN